MILTKENFLLYAAHHYENATCFNTEEFSSDLNNFRYLKKLFSRYHTSKDLKERLILNHLIIIINLFGVEPGVKMLFLKMEPKNWSQLKTFLIFLNMMPEVIHDYCHRTIVSADIPLDLNIVAALRNI